MHSVIPDGVIPPGTEIRYSGSVGGCVGLTGAVEDYMFFAGVYRYTIVLDSGDGVALRLHLVRDQSLKPVHTAA